MENRDKFLTEAMGECWHDIGYARGSSNHPYCSKCEDTPYHGNNDFSSAGGFFKLKEFMHRHPSEAKFFDSYLDAIADGVGKACETFGRITPDTFANAVYDFLKERE